MGAFFTILFKLFGFQMHLVGLIIAAVFWAAMGFGAVYFAKKHGKNPVLFFCLVFFLRLIGVIVCAIIIGTDQEQDRRNGGAQQHDSPDPFDSVYRNNSGNSGNYYQTNNPYTNPNRQQVGGTTRFGGSYSGYGNEKVQPSFICPSCGNVQEAGGFCMVCGTQLKKD